MEGWAPFRLLKRRLTLDALMTLDADPQCTIRFAGGEVVRQRLIILIFFLLSLGTAVRKLEK